MNPCEKNMTRILNMQILTAALFFTLTPFAVLAQNTPAASAPSANKSMVQKTFASPEAASKALADAVRAQDAQALLAIVGPASKSWLFTGDVVADREDWAKFLAAYDKKHGITLTNGRLTRRRGARRSSTGASAATSSTPCRRCWPSSMHSVSTRLPILTILASMRTRAGSSPRLVKRTACTGRRRTVPHRVRWGRCWARPPRKVIA
jgi:hypothetical protein